MLFGHACIPIVVDERLRQIAKGPRYTGMSFDLGSRDYLDFVDERFPSGESFRDFARRTRDFLDDLLERHDDDHSVLTIGWRLSPAILDHVCRAPAAKRPSPPTPTSGVRSPTGDGYAGPW